jgi:hypothetical protein
MHRIIPYAFSRSNPCLRGLAHFLANRVFLPALIVAILAIPGSVRAQSIQFTVMSSFDANGENIPSNDFVMQGAETTGVWAGEININVTQYAGQTVSPAKTSLTFCIQLNQDIYLGQSYTDYTVAPISQANGGTLTAQASKNLTTLYYLFYQGNSESNWTPIEATAFQLDCWKITSNPGNYILTGSSAGSTFYDTGWTSTTGTAVVALAQSWLTTVSGTNVTTGGSYEPVALTSSSNQDLMFTQSIQVNLVPFKVNAWPGAVALAGLAAFRMRRRMKRAACPS